MFENVITHLRRDLRVHIERGLGDTCLQPLMNQPVMGIVETRKLGARSKIFLFSKMVLDYGNRSPKRSPNLCLVNRKLGRWSILSVCE